ncbi:hypothetical protein [Paraglaciecola sp. 20A4]|uniref:hypothetical protein n=1 Tax=Paraglaciecola sp. 20A4 TaxID=2687288 RepID=UPI00140A4947|nr:hypothetical protein [Paraglaciecola sp. 20A4]
MNGIRYPVLFVKSAYRILVEFTKRASVFLGITFGVLFSMTATATLGAQVTILYPKPLSIKDHRPLYPLRLLQLALSKLDKPYALKPSKVQMTQGRALRMVGTQKAADVVWTMSTEEREQNYIPVRIPIYKGLIGWRLFLIHATQQSKFDHVTGLTELQHLTAGQGHDWPDNYILSDSGIDVMTSSSYERLFDMSDNERFDFFPRSIIEIWNELDAWPEYNLAVEKTILLRYPTAMYFFVSKDNQALADDIERGLKIAIKDGSFEQMFLKHNEWFIQRGGLNGRKVIDLPNPLIPSKTPLSDSSLWYQLTR